MLRQDLKDLLLPLLYIFDKALPNAREVPLTSTIAFILLSLSSRNPSHLHAQVPSLEST